MILSGGNKSKKSNRTLLYNRVETAESEKKKVFFYILELSPIRKPLLLLFDFI